MIKRKNITQFVYTNKELVHNRDHVYATINQLLSTCREVSISISSYNNIAINQITGNQHAMSTIDY